jgi:Flp pilus assembly protein TadG
MFAVIFGLMGTVLIALGGAVVDYITVEQNRSIAQIALDAAVLGLQSQIEEKSTTQLGADVLALVRDRLNQRNLTLSVLNTTVDKEEGKLRVTVRFDGPTHFVTLVGVHSLGAVLTSEATRKNQRVEIAMVLDNSGSMAESNRMGHLKAAAHQAINTFFKDQQPNDANPHMFVGIVPFTQFVNVGTDNANAAWLDRQGRSSIADDNLLLDPRAPIADFDRIDLFGQFVNESWRGCVEARPYPYDTDDTEPVSTSPNTLFVPLFAPDEPNTTWNGYNVFNNTYIADQRGQCEQPPQNQQWTERTLQERMCKYQGAVVSGASMENARGPNADCPNNELTPLSSKKSTVAQALAKMSPQGGTNIAQGVVWGMHMLTPSAPLKEASAFKESVSKVMIVMTDGDNFHAAANNMNGSTFYTAYGYPYNRRLGKPGDSTNQLRALMDQRLLAACTSAKKLDVTIYTIGLSVPSTSTENILKSCSSGDGYWFMPDNPNELDDIFERIADQLTLLRLSL